MEKTWFQKLMSVYTEHVDAEFEEKGDNKITKTLQDWENVSRDALLIAEMLGFEEILSWQNCIAPKFQDSYDNILKRKALTSPDQLLAMVLVGQTDEVMAISEKFDVSLLSEVIEKLILKVIMEDRTRTNILTVINNRPDTLTKFDDGTFNKIHINNDNATFLKNDKLYLLLNCLCESKDYKNFHNKIKQNERFFWIFNNNEIILQSWDKLSDFELVGATTFKSAMTVYDNASKNWQDNLNNFKVILRLMDNIDITSFISSIKKCQGEKSFYYDAAMIARELLVEKRLKNGETDFINLHYQIGIGYAAKDFSISKIKRKIIKAYLKS